MELGLSVEGQGLASTATRTKGAGRNRSKGLQNARLPLVSAQHALEVLEEKLSSRYKSVKDAFIHMDYDCDGRISSAEFRVTLDLMGLVMLDTEYAKLWSYFDTTNVGAINYTEFNNKVGALIHPPITRNIIDRPRTPRVRMANARKIAAGLKKKMNNLREAFHMIDSDGSGYISHAEFIQALRHVGITKISHDDSYSLMMKYKNPDDDANGITFEEFKKTMEEYLKVPEAEEEAKKAGAFDHLPIMSLNHAEKLLSEKLWGKFAAVQRAFRLFDEDKSGELSYDEFRAAMRSLGVNMTDPDFRELVAKYDTNGDGSISYDEFNTRVGPLIHPDTINHRMKDLMDRAGAQADALHFNPNAHLGLARPSTHERNSDSLSARARHMAPRLGLNAGEAMLVQQLFGRYSELQRAFREADKSGDGALSEAELVHMLNGMRVYLTDDAMTSLFARYDRNGDGSVSYDELNAVIGPLLHKTEQNSDLLGLDSALTNDATAPASEAGVAEGKEEVKEAESVRTEVTAGAGRPPAVPRLRMETAQNGGYAASGRASIRTADDSASVCSVMTKDIDLGATEDKMRKILGRAWVNVYKDMKRKQQKDGTSGLSTELFRDAMAERGVPLTSKEVRALANRYSSNGGSARPSARDLDVETLMRNTFSRGSARGSVASTARRSGRTAEPLSGAMSARMSAAGSVRSSRR